MEAKDILEIYGPSGLVFTIIILIIFYPEKIQIWSSWIHIYILRRFFKISKRKSVSLELQGKINDFKRGLNSKCPGILTYGIKIKWVHSEKINRKAFLEEGKVVVFLRSYEHQDVNFAAAVLIYLSKSLLPYAKQYVSEIASKSIDFTYAKKIIRERKSRATLDYFLNEILYPELNKNEELKSYCSIMDCLDNNGTLTSILIRELQILGRKLDLSVPERTVIFETRDFILFLNRLATKKKEEDVPLNFIRRYIKMSITPIAIKEKLRQSGIRLYKQAIQENIERRGIDRNYILACGQENVDAAKIVAKSIRNLDKIKKVTQITYRRAFIDAKPTKAITIILELK